MPTLKAEGYRFASLSDVPAIKRSLEAGPDDPSQGGCTSATLGFRVPEGACVQSRKDELFYRCADGEWAKASGPTDARCVGKTYPLR